MIEEELFDNILKINYSKIYIYLNIGILEDS